MRFINKLACRLWGHHEERSARQVCGRKLAVACCFRCGRQTVSSAYEAEEEAGLQPESAYESGQTLVHDLLILAPIAIAFAVAAFVLTSPSTDAAELARMGWADVTGAPAPF
jgi:hypothetical protein